MINGLLLIFVVVSRWCRIGTGIFAQVIAQHHQVPIKGHITGEAQRAAAAAATGWGMRECVANVAKGRCCIQVAGTARATHHAGRGDRGGG